MKLWDSLLGFMTKKDEPLHVGEVMHLWKILASLEEGRSILQGMLNHTPDPELKRYLESFLTDYVGPWVDRLKHFMQDHGIPLPLATTEKPKANEADIPPGAKFSDEEIAGLIAAKLVAGTGFVQQGLLECLNYELATMLLELEVSHYRQAFVLRETMERRGWLKRPPEWHASKASE
ncbi:MAG TPA: DUF3231 family protein [Symbiobacteriaceae bacterium]|nr:DUF3231 family protein [Symbiobacteriaceae bacterium]